MEKKHGPGSPSDAEQIVGAALASFGQGAGDIRLSLPAIESFHNQFIPNIRLALEQPGWQAAWRREKAYLLAYAEAMGHRAAEAAAEDRRRFITHQDVTFATTKMRGYMPIAGRWCPL